ncbi:LPXTG cell wall anchor domain-containing protein [Amycolatopsis lurida]
MLGTILLVLVLSAVLIVVGAFVEGLIWLLVIGVALFAGTAAIGFVKRKALTKGSR